MFSSALREGVLGGKGGKGAASDPFDDLLIQPLHFPDATQRDAYMNAIERSIPWVKDLSVAAVVVDGLVSDFPIVAVSDEFLSATKYPREEVIFTNCRFLLDNVTGPDIFRISRASRSALRAFCKLARFPGAVAGGADRDCQQPNAMKDGEILTNDFVIRRVYVQGHPMMVGVQRFFKEPPPGTTDRATVMAENARRATENEESMEWIVNQLHESTALADVLQTPTKVMGEGEVALCTGGGEVFYRGQGYHAPRNLLFYGDRSVLRQEPETLPNSGIIRTAEAMVPVPSLSGDGHVLRYALRIETLSKWSGYPPMGFTQTEPWSHCFPDALQFAPRTVCYSASGAVVNRGEEPIPPTTRIKPVQLTPENECPKLQEGDVLSVELTPTGSIRRYVNGTLVTEVATEYGFGSDGSSTWYGAFQVSFAVARASILVDPVERPRALEMPEPRAAAQEDQETRTLTAELADILTGVQDVSITIATQDADFPLIAVSDGFETLTGYPREDILGRNCRFLNNGADMSDVDRNGIREALAFGSRFTAVIPNRRKDSTPFLNLLDLRTLEVGVSASEGQPVRLFIGIQGEVDAGRNSSHWRAELPRLVSRVRDQICWKLQDAAGSLSTQTGLITPHAQPFWVDEQMEKKISV
jgi:PAS domain-containing protein